MDSFYRELVQIHQFEFGFCYHEDYIEIVVIDHASNQIRTLSTCNNESDAAFILETCIRYGFSEKGIVFQGVPGFILRNSELEFAGVSN